MIIPLRILVSLLLLPGIALTQTQIGEDIYVEADPLGTLYNDNVCLSSDGKLLAIGAPSIDGANGEDVNTGRVTVYKQEEGAWKPYGNAIYGDRAGDILGSRMSLSGDGSILAIGALFSSGVNGDKPESGEVRVYKKEGGTWVQIGETLYGDHSEDYFGWSISLSNDGTILAIAAIGNIGQVKVFKKESGSVVWKLMGDTLYGDKDEDLFGFSVSLSGDGTWLAVGADLSDGPDGKVIDRGQVKLFESISDTWVQREVLYGDSKNDYFGGTVSLSNDGNVLASVASGNDGKDGQTTSAGQVKVFKKESDGWEQLGDAFYGDTKGERLGYGGLSLSEDGSVLAIGSCSNENGLGEVKVFKEEEGSWISLEGENHYGSIYGHNSIDLSNDGSVLAIGSLVTNGDIEEGKAVRVFNLDATSLNTDDYLVSSSRIYPNPVEDHFYITLEGNLGLEKVDVYNVSGQLVLSTTSTKVDVSELPGGLYLAELHINKGKVTKKILVK